MEEKCRFSVEDWRFRLRVWKEMRWGRRWIVSVRESVLSEMLRGGFYVSKRGKIEGVRSRSGILVEKVGSRSWREAKIRRCAIAIRNASLKIRIAILSKMRGTRRYAGKPDRDPDFELRSQIAIQTQHFLKRLLKAWDNIGKSCNG